MINRSLFAFLTAAAVAVPSIACATPPPKRVLVVGASISWGCVNNCIIEGADDKEGYVVKLRRMLPNHEFHVRGFFFSGMADWDPKSGSIRSHNLRSSAWENNLDTTHNLWEFGAVPELRLWRPHYVVVMLGLGDVLRPTRNKNKTGRFFYKAVLERMVVEIRRAHAQPVLTVDAPFGQAITGDDALLAEYRSAIQDVCLEQRLRCGPDLTEWIDREAHYVGTDQIHPNDAGHEAIADAFAEWFRMERRR